MLLWFKGLQDFTLQIKAVYRLIAELTSESTDSYVCIHFAFQELEDDQTMCFVGKFCVLNFLQLPELRFSGPNSALGNQKSDFKETVFGLKC